MTKKKRLIECKPGNSKTLLDIALEKNMPVDHKCQGLGICGKCRIKATPSRNLSPLSQEEIDALTPAQIKNGERLACQTFAIGPVTIETVEETGPTPEREAVSKHIETGPFAVNPAVERITVSKEQVAHLHSDAFASMAQYITDCTAMEGLTASGFRDIPTLKAAAVLTPRKTGMTLVLDREKRVTAVLSGVRHTSLGLAVDIGTTTVAAYLVDLGKGEIIAAASKVNPQRRYGEDVITRITFADKDAANLETLHRAAVKAVNALSGECTEMAGVSAQDIDDVVIAGNTTMEQLFLNISPRLLGRSPFRPATLSFPVLTAAQAGLVLNPGTPVTVFPVISGFVGGDSLAAATALEPGNVSAATLIVDMGTNGEIVLKTPDAVWATSCATGPALEGSHISCGMRASAGAITKVTIDPATWNVTFETYGDPASAMPTGICGSGIIDAVSQMVRASIVRPDGRFNDQHADILKDEQKDGYRFVIASADKSATGRQIAVTMKDIREVQLAKAALASGIRMLLEKAGVRKVEETFITGAFGTCFNIDNALYIGMLPGDLHLGRIKSVDNLAGKGAVAALCDRKKRALAFDLASQIQFVDLAEDKRFTTIFAGATYLDKNCHAVPVE